MNIDTFPMKVAQLAGACFDQAEFEPFGLGQMRCFANFASIILSAIVFVSTADAQSSFADFEKKSSAVQTELEQFRKALNADDPDYRLQAIVFMLKSGKPHLEKAAKDHGLYSTDQDLQNATLRAIFDAGAQFRLIVNSTGEESTPAFQWLVRQYGGVHDGKVGSASLIVGKYDPKSKCWLRYPNNRKCFIRLNGNSINIWLTDAQASMTLDDEAIFRGKLRTHFISEGWADASIDISQP